MTTDAITVKAGIKFYDLSRIITAIFKSLHHGQIAVVLYFWPLFQLIQYIIGGPACAVSAPYMWNKLPRELRQCTNLEGFKKGLKAYLFKEAYC